MTATRTPVLVIVDAAADAGPRLAPGSARPGSSLLPSTRLRVAARLAPALSGGGDVAAVLRVRGSAPPRGGGGAVRCRSGSPDGCATGCGQATDGLRRGRAGAAARAGRRGHLTGHTGAGRGVQGHRPRPPPRCQRRQLHHPAGPAHRAARDSPSGPSAAASRPGWACRCGRPRCSAARSPSASWWCAGRTRACCGRRPAGRSRCSRSRTGRRRSLIPALATAVLLLVLYDPWLARSYGFLLSVLATGALLTLAPRWSAALRRRRVPPRLAEALAAAAAAQAAVRAGGRGAVGPGEPGGGAVQSAGGVRGRARPRCWASRRWRRPRWRCRWRKALAWCASWPAGWIAEIARHRGGPARRGSGLARQLGRGGAAGRLVTVVVVTRRADGCCGTRWLCGGAARCCSCWSWCSRRR